LSLAHNINFGHNELMINKIKDFLNKRQKGQDSSAPTDGLPDSYDSGYQAPRNKNRLTENVTGVFHKLSGKGGGTGAPSFNRTIERVLSRSSRESIHQIFFAALVFFITYALGKTVALVMRGQPTVSSARDHVLNLPMANDFDARSLSRVQAINLFRTEGTTGTKQGKPVDVKCEVAQQASSLPIKLVNTTVLQDTVKSLASVQVRGGRNLQDVRVGEQIDNLAKIFKITRLGLLVRNLETGTCESISSDRLTLERPTSISVLSPAASREYLRNRKMPGIENVGNKFIISQSLLNEKMKDIGSILTQARALRIQNPDGSLSFKMTEMDPEGLFPYLGLQDQDIITSINGKPIYDMNEVMQLFARIQNLESLQLGIKREGTDSVQEYSIKK
jgi:type II secretory pathway component PulC